MKIAIYHPWIRCRGGCERVILELVSRLKMHEWTIFTNQFEPKKTFPEFGKLNVKVLKQKPPSDNFLMRGVTLGSGLLCTKIKELKDYDVFVVSTGGVGELITIRNHEIPTIVYSHTILRAAHDFYDYYLDKMETWKKIPFMIGVFVYKFLEKWAWKYFKFILCNSNNVKNRILKAGLADGKNMTIIHPGVDVEKFKPSWKFKKYFLVPGRIKSYKRFELAVEAFKQFRTKNKQFKLIIAGHPDDEKYLKYIKSLVKDTDSVKIIEAPSDKKLISLYKGCYAVLFTAKDEDWGIVPLEAMACGKPVISVNEGGARESLIDGKTGFLVNADPAAFCDKMIKLADSKDLVKRIGKIAREHSKKFSWDNFVKEFDLCLTRVK